MLIGVTTTGKIVLAVAAGLLVVFALASSFLMPRRDPDFPGNRLGAFIAVTVLLFAVVIGAMVAFGAESEEGHAGSDEAASTEPATTEPATTGTETDAGTETGGEGEGDAAAGEAVFAANGCASCHVLEAAGASGSIGPNLDESQPDYALVVDRVTNGAGAMPAFGDQLGEDEIQNVAAYVVASTSG